jgi:hypothetical protein
MPRYKIVVADNFHYMDEDEYADGGVFDSYAAAVEACREIVDRSLAACHEPGMSPDELYNAYVASGDDPFIVALDDAPRGERYSAWNYAKERCPAICGKPTG